jgi:signal transduction histidine kinase
VRWRLIAVLVGVVAMVLAVHDLPLASHLRQVERDRLVTGLERDAFTIAGRAEDALQTGDPEQAASVADRLAAYRDQTGSRVIVTDADGITVATSDEEANTGSDYSTRPEVAAALSGVPTSGERDSTTLGTRLLYVAVPVLSGEEVVGSVRITYPAAEIGERVESRVRGLLVVALLSVAVALAAAVLFAATVTRPLRRLRSATEQLAAGDLSVRAPTDDGPPEIRALAASFNLMGDRLERTMARQRAFASDASHQLRTPLTALRLRLEQARELIDDDPDTAQARLEAATDETQRLQHLVDGLLALARAEGRAAATEVVDVGRVATERTEIWDALAAEQGVELRCQVPEGLLARVVPGALEQILDNYLDNALRVAPSGSGVDVVARAEGDDLVLEVRDRGPGMTDAQLDRAFDRFWRAADAPPGGSGLGLAIVLRLAEASGGTARLRRRAEGGTSAEVRLPLVRQPAEASPSR